MSIGTQLERILPQGFYRVVSRAYMEIKLFGGRYTCPFCGKSYKDFFPAGLTFPVLKEKDVVGGGYREHVRCPHCSSSGRERLMLLYLLNEANVGTARLSMLHVAPEPNLQRFLKSQQNVQHESIDIDSKLADKKMDLLALQYPDANFDIVICSHVLEHVSDDKRAMREIFRVLKPGGFAILQTPIANALSETYEDSAITLPEERERAYGQFDHVRLYAKEDYIARLSNAGFSVDVVPYAEKLGGDMTARYALDPREDLFICRKP